MTSEEVITNLFCLSLLYLSVPPNAGLISLKIIGMNRVVGFFFSVFFLLAVSCANKKQNGNDVNPESIYFDYKITANEGDDNFTVMLQYRDGESGDAFSIKENGKVMLDDEPFPEDSTKMTGAFYEMYKPVDGFSGKHSIVFTDLNKKEYKEEFNFSPVVLKTFVADTILRNELVFEFGGLDSEDYIRVLMTDTSFFNNGINRVDIVKNGRLIISKADLENLANGPIQLEFIREHDSPVKNGTNEGGRLQVTYSLKREFFLKD